MKIAKIAVVLFSVLGTSYFGVSEAKADIVQVNFSGNYTFTDSTGFLSAAGVNSGDILTGNFTYDTTAVAFQSYTNDGYGPEAGYHLLTYNFNIANKVFGSFGANLYLKDYNILTGNTGWAVEFPVFGTMTNIASGSTSTSEIAAFIQYSDPTIPSSLGLSTNLPSVPQFNQAYANAVYPNGSIFFRLNNNSYNPVSGGYTLDGTVNNLQLSASSVPEPSTYALFGIGAIGMLMVMRRKKTA